MQDVGSGIWGVDMGCRVWGMWIRDLGMQDMGCEVRGVKGEGCGVRDVGYGMWDAGYGMQGVGFRMRGVRFGMQDAGFGMQGVRFGMQGAGRWVRDAHGVPTVIGWGHDTTPGPSWGLGVLPPTWCWGRSPSRVL